MLIGNGEVVPPGDTPVPEDGNPRASRAAPKVPAALRCHYCLIQLPPPQQDRSGRWVAICAACGSANYLGLTDFRNVGSAGGIKVRWCSAELGRSMN